MHPFYKLETPSISSDDKKLLLEKMGTDRKSLFQVIHQANYPEYLHWERLKHIIPSFNLKAEVGWLFIRDFRDFSTEKTIIRSEIGEFFRWFRLQTTDEYLHKIDMYVGGRLSNTELLERKNQLIIRGIMEEAIASSQLEGAHTTRNQAKKMLLENRQPKNNSEQMIVNNYKTIRFIENELKDSEISLERIFDLHRQLTKDTDIEPGEIGRLRTDQESIRVEGFIGTQEYTTHIPPKEGFLNEEIKRLIQFANDEDGSSFLHPVIRAIFLHFWIGYLHPFTDGNGRLARALFYWYLLKHGYWMMAFIPISTVIKKAPAQYAKAYIYTEQDSFDLTYFYDFHIQKIIQAINEFEQYITEKINENNKIDESLGRGLNERQKQLIHYFLGDYSATASIMSHMHIHRITRQTAAKDLRELEKKGILVSRRAGQSIRYYAGEILKEGMYN